MDDMDCKRMLKVITTEEGQKYLKTIMDPKDVDFMKDKLGISGIANIIAAIKTAKYYDLKEGENVMVIATDSIDRYHSVMDQQEDMTFETAKRYHERIFLYQEPSYFFEGDRMNKARWHNLKYYTWVEQQGKTVEELNDQREQSYWLNEADKVEEFDKLILEYREKHKKELNEMMGL